MVRYFPQSFPAWGVLIDENNQIVNSLNIECSKFKTRGFRYKHKKWPSPNRDFIPVTVELISNPSEWVVKSERHFIQGRVRRNFSSYRDSIIELLANIILIFKEQLQLVVQIRELFSYLGQN